MTEEKSSFEKTGLRLLLLTIVVIAAIAAYIAVDVLLLGFLGILFAAFLVKVSNLLKRFVPLAYHWNLAIVVTLLLAISIGSLVTFGFSVESRLEEASNRIDDSSQQFKEWLSEHPVAMSTIESIPFVGKLMGEQLSIDENASSNLSENGQGSDNREPAQEGSETGSDSDGERTQTDFPEDSPPKQQANEAKSSPDASAASGLAGRTFSVASDVLKTTFGVVTNLAVIFFIGVFIAVDPALYRDGFSRLFAIDRRSRVVEVMNKMGDALFNWLIGRSIAMLVTGLGTGIALWILGVPLAFTVGAITGVLTFIPNIGAITSLLLAMLLALSQGPATVMWVVVLYTALQLIESNVVTPLVQQHQTSIPPALLIAFQLFMGVLVGFLGVLVSTPLLAAMLVLVNEVWVKDTLGDEADAKEEVPGVEN